MHEVHLLNYLDYIYCRRVFPNQLRYVIGRQCNKNNGIHSIKYAGWTNPSLPRGGISTSYAILILRNNWKIKKYILMFGKIKINKPGICKYTIKTMKRLFSVKLKKKNTRLTQPIRFSRVERWVEKACIWFHGVKPENMWPSSVLLSNVWKRALYLRHSYRVSESSFCQHQLSTHVRN